MSDNRRSGLRVGVALAALTAAASGGWIAALNIQSPAEVAARTAPPEPSLITVPIELVELSSDVVVRGDVRYDSPTTLSLSGSLGPDIESPVVTGITKAGDQVEDGDVVMEVSGRPILVLQGDIPMYRALRPGSVGADVVQLETALNRLGYLEAVPDDLWDTATSTAVTAWYQAAGYSPNPPPTSDTQALDAAHVRLRSAEASLREAEASLVAANVGVSESMVIAARSTVATAQEQLAATEGDTTEDVNSAHELIADAQSASAASSQALATAHDRLVQAEQGVHPDTGVAPTNKELDDLRMAVTVAEDALATALQDISDAESHLGDVTAGAASRIRQANDDLAIAEAQLSEVLSPPDSGAQRRQVTAAVQERNDASEAVALMTNNQGPWIPAGELIYASQLPSRIDEVALNIGDSLTADFMTISASTLSIHTAVPVRDASLVTFGAAVTIHHDSLAQPLDGAVARIAGRPGTDGVAGDAISIGIAVEAIPRALTGLNVKVVIPIESSNGAVLAVPAAALSVTTTGETQVEILDGDAPRIVNVTVGLSADGLVEIRPAPDGLLKPGMQVVIGRNSGT